MMIRRERGIKDGYGVHNKRRLEGADDATRPRDTTPQHGVHLPASSGVTCLVTRRGTMFRMGGPRLDPAEERRQAQEEERMARLLVYSNIGTFLATIGIIRAAPYILERFF
ncbi:uncharacterized protein [Procambarus clarkii]|uniref:uncharacterized protein n=1 Tax=Procambarus clarkii TaxID=6728 RepID=UPI003742F876